jgi:hypothetical protein
MVGREGAEKPQRKRKKNRSGRKSIFAALRAAESPRKSAVRFSSSAPDSQDQIEDEPGKVEDEEVHPAEGVGAEEGFLGIVILTESLKIIQAFFHVFSFVYFC